jgi:hypothetical protein
MKVIGGIIVVLYALMAYRGWEPFTRAERGTVTSSTSSSRGSGGGFFVGGSRYRSGGFMGGK